MDKNFIKQILLFVALLSGFALFYIVLFPGAPKLLEGKRAPDFFAKAIQSGQSDFRLSETVGKKVVLLNIWATWCGPCRQEIPILNRYYKAFQGQGFEIVALMEDDAETPEAALALLNPFTKELPINFPVYIDPNAAAAEAFGSVQIPETFLIDKTGHVIHVQRGPIEAWQEKAIFEKIKKLL